MSKRSYIIKQYGAGFCRNGHSRAVYGTGYDGTCKECRRKNNHRRYLKVKAARRREGNTVEVPLGW